MLIKHRPKRRESVDSSACQVLRDTNHGGILGGFRESEVSLNQKFRDCQWVPLQLRRYFRQRKPGMMCLLDFIEFGRGFPGGLREHLCKVAILVQR